MKIKVAATQMSCTWEIEENISKAVKKFAITVKNKKFPQQKHSYK